LERRGEPQAARVGVARGAAMINRTRHLPPSSSGMHPTPN
jgi:hypothetical protein